MLLAQGKQRLFAEKAIEARQVAFGEACSLSVSSSNCSWQCRYRW